MNFHKLTLFFFLLPLALSLMACGSTSREFPTPTSLSASPTPPIPPPNPAIGDVWLSPIDEMALVFVPAGAFLLGSNAADPEGRSSEQPQLEVSLPAFWIDQTEVTNGMFSQCVGEGGCSGEVLDNTITRNNYYSDLSFGEFPVVNVNWKQATDYCVWAGRHLPTEAEWEKAARGPEGALYPWGDSDPGCDELNFANPGPGQGQCAEDTLRVGSFPDGASPYGALDMAGNVWEWVSDWYAPDVYTTLDPQAPAGPAFGETRVIRGGGYADGDRDVRAANRHHTDPTIISYFIGFRCALDAVSP
jgi:formylglycine-generating enzyme required for sulfatase activity